MIKPEKILVTGATGYIGGRLVPRLLNEEYQVRCLVRDPDRLRLRPWEKSVEIVRGDLLDEVTLPPALQGIDVAYYLVHSMDAGEKEYADRDRRAADNFGRAARDAGVKRIIYLGGIQPKSERLSKHLQSRLETGERLRSWGVPVTAFRAAVIVGAGSLSFELIRYLTERIPVLITPKWVRTPTQPIAVRNVTQYLIQALQVPESADRVIEIGGTDVLTYGDMFRIYARVRGLKRPLVGVPVLTPRFSSLWVGLVTPLNSRIARPLIDGLDNEVVVGDNTANELFNIELLSYEEAVRRAFYRFERDDIETIWSGAVSTSTKDSDVTRALERKEGLIRERHQIRVKSTPENIFSVIKSLGGDNGWLYGNTLWRLRGFLDLLVGSIGMRKSRRSYTNIRIGDTIDFWRVEAFEENYKLRLRAEMNLPGTAWLQYIVEPGDPEESLVSQTAYYDPKGIVGLLYWQVSSIPHRFIFPGMLRELGRRAEALEKVLDEAS